MIKAISKTPTFILFISSVFPYILVTESAKLWAFTNVIFIIFFAFWIYSVTIELLKRKTAEKPFENINKFRIILILSLIYSIFLSVYFGLTSKNYDEPPWIFLIVIPGNLFVGYAYFYLLNYLSKTIASVESKSNIKFEGYASYFFLLIFFPVGIWWVNPKIIMLLHSTSETAL